MGIGIFEYDTIGAFRHICGHGISKFCPVCIGHCLHFLTAYLDIGDCCEIGTIQRTGLSWFGDAFHPLGNGLRIITQWIHENTPFTISGLACRRGCDHFQVIRTSHEGRIQLGTGSHSLTVDIPSDGSEIRWRNSNFHGELAITVIIGNDWQFTTVTVGEYGVQYSRSVISRDSGERTVLTT